MGDDQRVEDICLKYDHWHGFRVCRGERDGETSDEGFVWTGIADEQDTRPEGRVRRGKGEVDPFREEGEDGCAGRVLSVEGGTG